MFEATQPASLAAVFDTEGAEVSETQMMQPIINAVPNVENPEDEVGKVVSVKLHLNTVDWTARDMDGAIWPTSHIVARTSFTMTRTSHDFSTHRYKGGGKEYSVASADAVLGEPKRKVSAGAR